MRIHLLLISLMFLPVGITYSAEEPMKQGAMQVELFEFAPNSTAMQQMTLKANDEKTMIALPIEIAKLSHIIINLFEDLGTQAVIPLDISPTALMHITNLLFKLSEAAKGLPSRRKIESLSTKIDNAFNVCGYSEQELIETVEYLDIEVLMAPLANTLARRWNVKSDTISQRVFDNITHFLNSDKAAEDSNKAAQAMELVILSAPIVSPKLSALIAKYWYLNYGNTGYHTARWLDYGFSIEELLDYNKLPAIKHEPYCGRTLNLNFSKVNDLTGLQKVPGLTTVKTLKLLGNQLTSLAPHAFDGLNNLTELDLRDNQLTSLSPHAFDDLKNLVVLNLSANRLTILQPNIFSGLNCLRQLYLRDNTLVSYEVDSFNDLPRLRILDISNNPFETGYRFVNNYKNLNEIWGRHPKLVDFFT